MIAVAFLCGIHAADCEKEAVARAIVGRGATPNGCFMDGMMGAAANVALEPDADHRLVILCRRSDALLAGP